MVHTGTVWNFGIWVLYVIFSLGACAVVLGFFFFFFPWDCFCSVCYVFPFALFWQKDPHSPQGSRAGAILLVFIFPFTHMPPPPTHTHRSSPGNRMCPLIDVFCVQFAFLGNSARLLVFRAVFVVLGGRLSSSARGPTATSPGCVPHPRANTHIYTPAGLELLGAPLPSASTPSPCRARSLGQLREYLPWRGGRGLWGCVCPWAGIGRWLALVGDIGPLCTIYREREPLWVLLALGHFLNYPGLNLGL